MRQLRHLFTQFIATLHNSNGMSWVAAGLANLTATELDNSDQPPVLHVTTRTLHYSNCSQSPVSHVTARTLHYSNQSVTGFTHVTARTLNNSNCSQVTGLTHVTAGTLNNSNFSQSPVLHTSLQGHHTTQTVVSNWSYTRHCNEIKQLKLSSATCFTHVTARTLNSRTVVRVTGLHTSLQEH